MRKKFLKADVIGQLYLEMPTIILKAVWLPIVGQDRLERHDITHPRPCC